MTSLRRFLALLRVRTASAGLAAVALSLAGCTVSVSVGDYDAGPGAGAAVPPVWACLQSAPAVPASPPPSDYRAALTRRWYICGFSSLIHAHLDDIGIEFTSDWRWHRLIRGNLGYAQPSFGIDNEGTWTLSGDHISITTDGYSIGYGADIAHYWDTPRMIQLNTERPIFYTAAPLEESAASCVPSPIAEPTATTYDTFASRLSAHRWLRCDSTSFFLDSWSGDVGIEFDGYGHWWNLLPSSDGTPPYRSDSLNATGSWTMTPTPPEILLHRGDGRIQRLSVFFMELPTSLRFVDTNDSSYNYVAEDP